ncbi:hypothetical protein V8C40DRAFT_240161 [Trichoderma camerunense]
MAHDRSCNKSWAPRKRAMLVAHLTHQWHLEGAICTFHNSKPPAQKLSVQKASSTVLIPVPNMLRPGSNNQRCPRPRAAREASCACTLCLYVSPSTVCGCLLCCCYEHFPLPNSFSCLRTNTTLHASNYKHCLHPVPLTHITLSFYERWAHFCLSRRFPIHLPCLLFALP